MNQVCEKCEIISKQSFDYGYLQCKKDLSEIVLTLEREIQAIKLKLEIL